MMFWNENMSCHVQMMKKQELEVISVKNEHFLFTTAIAIFHLVQFEICKMAPQLDPFQNNLTIK